MSIIITTYVREGIVLSSDSRLSISNDALKVKDVTQSDAVRKTFITKKSIGISTCGQADINGVPIAGYVDSFIGEEIGEEDLSVEILTKRLLSYFRNLKEDLNTIFHVAGYDTIENNGKTYRKQQVFRCYINQNRIQNRLAEAPGQGSIFDGYNRAIAKLINPVFLPDKEGKPANPVPFNGIAWSFFNLQDAIDFNRFCIQTTIDLMRFEIIEKTVGGPVDILVITPENYLWVQKKILT